MDEQRQAYMEEEHHRNLEKNKTKKVPHLININEDPALSGVLLYYIEEEETTLGTAQADPAPTITLKGLNIQKKHAVFTKRGKVVKIQPGSEVIRYNFALNQRIYMYSTVARCISYVAENVFLSQFDFLFYLFDQLLLFNKTFVIQKCLLSSTLFR